MMENAYEKEAGVKDGLLACAPQPSPAAAVYKSAAFQRCATKVLLDNTFNSQWWFGSILSQLNIPSLLIRTRQTCLTLPHTTDFFQQASPTPDNNNILPVGW